MLNTADGEAIYFGPAGASLFGWLHRTTTGAPSASVAIICPPIGFDAVCTFRSMRVTAAALANAGIPTLRFDYYGTGNSAGDPRDPAQWDRWLASVSEAIEAARSHTSAPRVALIGVRAGALIAATAAANRREVTDLVMWAPPRSGRHFVRELQALGRLTNGMDEQPGDIFEAAGFPMTEETAVDLSRVGPAVASNLKGRRVLVVGRDDFQDDPVWPDHLTAAGADVTTERIAGTSGMLVEPMSAKPPFDLIARIVEWVAVPAFPADTALPSGGIASAGRVAPGATEEAIRFGNGRRLFGVITRPDRTGTRGVMVLNTGAEYHIGPHRTYVALARDLAKQGVPVFRWDLGGLGESLAPDESNDDVSYPNHALTDIATALAEFRRRTGVVSVDLVGICSGAWHAFAAARAGLDVQGFLAVNPPLYLREGPDYSLDELWTHREAERYRRSLLDRSRLRKFLRGQGNIRHFGRVLKASLVRWIRRAAPVSAPTGSLIGELAAIDRRGIRAHFTFSSHDPGQTYFEMRVNRSMTRELTGLSWNVVEGADHTFRPLEAQAALRERVERFVQAGAAGAPSQNHCQVSSSPSLSGVIGS